MKKIPKNADNFNCEYCDFNTSKFSNYQTHISTSKHKNRTNLNILEQKKQGIGIFGCKHCDKKYTARNSLWYHEKKCKQINENPNDNIVVELFKLNQDFKDMIVEQNKTIVDQNHEFQKQMLETLNEVCKNNNSNVLNQCNINSNNKAFNLNVFLNEDCKDAMNVNEFIDSFNLQLSDFENVGNVGFVNGISDIIIKKLKALDISERPIHCTDQKRQVLYAKVIDKWEKEGDDNKILRRIIKCVAFKNSKNIQLFRDKYPDCMNWDSKHADRYQILRIESLGGLNNEDIDNENKIIRKIAKEILIDKSL